MQIFLGEIHLLRQLCYFYESGLIIRLFPLSWEEDPD